MDSAGDCSNCFSFFIFFPDLSLVPLYKNGNRFSFYVFGEKICNSADYFIADYPNILLSEKANEALTITLHTMFRNL